MDMDRIPTAWAILIGLLFGIGVGYVKGKQVADRWYRDNPVLVQVSPKETEKLGIVLCGSRNMTSGDVSVFVKDFDDSLHGHSIVLWIPDTDKTLVLTPGSQTTTGTIEVPLLKRKKP